MNSVQTAVNIPLMRTVESRFQNGQQLRLKKKKEKRKEKNAQIIKRRCANVDPDAQCKRGSRSVEQTKKRTEKKKGDKAEEIKLKKRQLDKGWSDEFLYIKEEFGFSLSCVHVCL